MAMFLTFFFNIKSMQKLAELLRLHFQGWKFQDDVKWSCRFLWGFFVNNSTFILIYFSKYLIFITDIQNKMFRLMWNHIFLGGSVVPVVKTGTCWARNLSLTLSVFLIWEKFSLSFSDCLWTHSLYLDHFGLSIFYFNWPRTRIIGQWSHV